MLTPPILSVGRWHSGGGVGAEQPKMVCVADVSHIFSSMQFSVGDTSWRKTFVLLNMQRPGITRGIGWKSATCTWEVDGN